MPWQTPKTNWAVGDGVSNSDFNRIEGNTQEAYNKTGNIGEIKFVARATLMQNELKANGASLSTALYPELFAEIGYTFGGSGGTFNLPDLRGEFLRAWDDGKGTDSGRILGSWQSDAFKAHNHGIPNGITNSNNPNYLTTYFSNASFNWNIKTTSDGGTETRPRNIALMAVIIYK